MINEQQEHPIQRADADVLSAGLDNVALDVWANTNMWDDTEDDDNAVRGID